MRLAMETLVRKYVAKVLTKLLCTISLYSVNSVAIIVFYTLWVCKVWRAHTLFTQCYGIQNALYVHLCTTYIKYVFTLNMYTSK